MPRAIYIVLDSLGVGGAPDADSFGDVGANTFGHIAEACENAQADKPGLRAGPLKVPNLLRMGLGAAMTQASGLKLASLATDGDYTAAWGSAIEQSYGKDTPSGHFEMTGVPVRFDWLMFPRENPAFPAWLLDFLQKEADVPGFLGMSHASGPEIIDRFGLEHMESGKPILYTSADSVLQIAAHEESFGLERLYELCAIARAHPELEMLGRVIARPFIGDGASQPFRRTFNRRDLAMPCPGDTLLDLAVAAGQSVTAIGKVSDIFAGRGITKKVTAGDNEDIVGKLIASIKSDDQSGVIFANLVEFDSEFGHRRDVPGYAAALEWFDTILPEIRAAMQPGDVAVITADHGNDPTAPGSDHTREQVPAIFFGAGVHPANLGVCDGMADIGQTMAQHLGLGPLGEGKALFETSMNSSMDVKYD